jgi:hypothetical protein
MGIASFVMFLVAAALFVGVIAVAGYLASFLVNQTGEGTIDPQSFDPESLEPEVARRLMVFGAVATLLSFGVPVTNLVGFGLGIAGLVQQQRKKLFAGLGTILNGLSLLAIVILLVLAFLAGGIAPAG